MYVLNLRFPFLRGVLAIPLSPMPDAPAWIRADGVAAPLGAGYGGPGLGEEAREMNTCDRCGTLRLDSDLFIAPSGIGFVCPTCLDEIEKREAMEREKEKEREKENLPIPPEC